MKKKVLGVCRVSTTSQEIQSQIDELRAFIYSEGYQEEEIIWITGYGCSAIKEDDQFRYNIAEIHKQIQSGNIVKLYAWALDRVARRKVTMDILIEDLAENKVNMIIKEPNRMELLNADGSRNDGMELAISLFTHLAEAEMRNKKARFARGKKRNSESGRYNGGPSIKYGYCIDKDKYFIIDPDTAPIVIMAFELYAQGYTLSQLSKEMKQRGYDFVTVSWAHRVLNDKSYLGLGRNIYPRIISDELFQKVQELKSANTIGRREKKHYYFGSRLIKCPECGLSLIASHDAYQCKCKKAAISIANMDGLLWYVAFAKEGHWRQMNDSDSKAAQAKEKAVLARKIKAADNSKAKVEIKRQRALNAYLDAAITEEQYKERLSKINDELKSIENNIAEWQEAIRRIDDTANIAKDDLKARMDGIMNNIQESDEKEMQAIVRKWISRVELDLPIVKIICTDGKEYRAKYHLRMKKMIWSTMGGGYIAAYPIFRTDDKAYRFDPHQPDTTNMGKAMARYEREIGLLDLIGNIDKFWNNSIL